MSEQLWGELTLIDKTVAPMRFSQRQIAATGPHIKLPDTCQTIGSFSSAWPTQ